ncbi:amino acid adenylation domain-containing protein [Saccharothrix saharensis]|uniref:non-ribosomal peptide synthetase n=1 Tax=Saccharothrix saharensis TaxID=571190 RepID=UPI0036C62EAE
MNDSVARAEPDTAAARREVLRARLAANGLAAGVGHVPFPRVDGAGPHPLSSAQRRMWFAQQHDPGGAAYNICAGFRIAGPLEPERLHAAFRAVVADQEILRTVYRAGQDGVPGQLVLPEVDLHMTAVALPDDVPDPPAAVDELVRAHGGEPFDLSSDCPLRLLLVRIAVDEHVLVLIAHHIALDDLSWEPVLSAAARHYSGERAEAPATRFVEFARWESDRADAGAFAESLQHWRRVLRPWPAQAVLPATRTGRERSGRGIRRRLTLPTATANAVGALADRTRCTPFMVVLACLRAVLHRYAPDTDPAVATVVIPKSRPELTGMVGNFGNTVLVHAAAEDGTTFTELLTRTRQACLDAFDHQEVPFDLVVEELRPPRAVDGAGLFGVMFTQRGHILRGVEFPGQRWTEFPVFNGTSRFDLAVELLAAPDSFVLTATGADALFDDDALDRVLGHLETVITAVAIDPDRDLARLPLLTDAERTRVVDDWNATDQPEYLPTRTLTDLLAEQAARTPHAPALTWDGGTLDYAEVDAAANRLANHLIAQGIGPGDLVGVLVPRSPDQITAILAILKVGGALLALDPDWPVLRVAEVVIDSEPAAVLTTPAGVDSLFGTCRPPLVVDLTADAPLIAACAETAPSSSARLDDTAYVIHTSGSTGTPKGVMISHRSIVNRLPWQIDLLKLTAGDAVLHKAPMSFDIAINEIFLPLAAGARLVLAPPGAEGDVTALLTTIARHRVTFVYLVSSLLDLMVDREDADTAFRELRHVWCGGEVLTAELYRRFRQRSDARMYHGYGPAEATIGVTCRVLESTEDVRNMTLGRPNPNTRVYLLDKWGAPVPIGVVGEIHIGGVQVAQGYLNDPVRTRERFVPDPFRGDGTLYRTGDLARYRADGHIEFVGRVDNQVKIGGRRVELEEVEAKLATHPAVRQAVVLLRTDAGRGAALVAHVAVGDAVIGGAELAEWLSRRLPAHMVPAVIRPVPALPVKASGKVDREALSSVGLPGPDRAATAFAAPRGAAQQVVADIWARLLEVDRVGADDNFFDLGGHSMLMLRVQAEIRRELGRDVSVVTLFDHPTVRSIAGLLGTAGDEADDEERRELLAVRRRAGRQRRGAQGRVPIEGDE